MLKYVILILIVFIYVSAFVYVLYHKKQSIPGKCWVINLEKNKERLKRFMYFYNNSDINTMNLQRFNAIYGKNIDVEPYLTPHAYKTLLENERNQYRTKHYQLTRGAIGCYLSHTAIYKKLLQDQENDYYIIFEDDAALLPSINNKIKVALDNAPMDWDMILFAPIMEVISDQTFLFKKYSSFWGLSAYIINKRGAKKFMDQFNKQKINMQIDSKMSFMCMHYQFNVYGFKEKIIWYDRSMVSDINMPVRLTPYINPYLIEDL